MNKADLINAIAAQTEGISKPTLTAVLNAAFTTIQHQLADGGSVQLLGFGSFTTRTRAARRGRHPHTGEPLKIPAAKIVKFSPGKAFKERVNQSQAKGKGKGTKK